VTVALGPNGDKGLLIDLPGTDEPTVEWLRGILTAAHQQPTLIVFVCDGRTLFSAVNDADQALDALSFPEAATRGWLACLFNPRAVSVHKPSVERLVSQVEALRREMPHSRCILALTRRDRFESRYLGKFDEAWAELIGTLGARLGAESVFSVGTECTWTEQRCRLESAHEHGYDSDSLEVALSLPTLAAFK